MQNLRRLAPLHITDKPMAAISLYLDARTKSKSGVYPVKFSVRNGKSSFFIPTNVKVKPENWNNGTVIGTKNDRLLNQILTGKLMALRLKLISLSAVENLCTISARQLAALLDESVHEKDTHDKNIKDNVADAFDSFISLKKKDTTKEVYIFTKQKIGRFCEAHGICFGSLRFKDIDYEWLCAFDRWLEDSGSAVNTRSIHLRNLRAVYNEAVKLGCVDGLAYPFKKFRIKSEETRKRSLSVSELRTLRDFACEEHLKQWVDVFFISFYLAGINMADLLALPSMKKGERLVYRRSKTNVLCEMEIPDEAWALIDKYHGKKLLLVFGEKYKNRKDFIHRANEGLKSVGRITYTETIASNGAKHKKKVRKPLFPELTTYWARHSWATIAADIDVPDAVIDAALGHRSPYRMTDIYVRRNARKVDDAVRRVIRALNGE